MKKSKRAAKSNEGFNFLPQCYVVERLLNACVAAIPNLPPRAKNELSQTLREFENFASPTLWGPADVDQEYGLTDEEKREVIARFVNRYACAPQDWDMIGALSNEVRTEREMASHCAA